MRLFLAGLLLIGSVSVADATANRSREVTRQFQKMYPCPLTGKKYGACPGYVKDHIVPLCAGGADSVANMQWQTKKDSFRKDREERAMCRRGFS